MKRQVLLTGSSGLVGSHLLPALQDTCDVYAYQGDLAHGLPADLPTRLDVVIHLAQSRKFRDFPHSAAEVAKVNALAAVDLAQFAVAAGATQFIFTSTGGVYRAQSAPLTEAGPIADPEAMTFYAATKLAAERLLAPFSTCLDVVILRPFFIYGRGQEASMLIPRLINSVKDGRPISLSGDDGLRTNPIHVSDAVDAIRAGVDLQGSHVINIAGPEVLTIREIAAQIGLHAGRAPTFVIDPDGNSSDLIGDIGKMEQLLCRPSGLFRERVGEMIK